MITQTSVRILGDNYNDRELIICDCGQIVANVGQYVCSGCFREWARLWKDDRNGTPSWLLETTARTPQGYECPVSSWAHIFQRAAGLLRDGFTIDGTRESFTATHRDGRTISLTAG